MRPVNPMLFRGAPELPNLRAQRGGVASKGTVGIIGSEREMRMMHFMTMILLAALTWEVYGYAAC